METATQESVQAACEETLRRFPEFVAAVLFGSRARGTNRSDSDWDVALVSRAGRRVPQDIPLRQVGGVDWRVLPEGDLRQRANALGSLAWAIAREGQLLAGQWAAPEPEDGKLHIDASAWAGFLLQSLTQARHGADDLSAAVLAGNMAEAVCKCAAFAASSADAAEHLAKAVLLRRLVEPNRTHDMEDLAKQLEDADGRHSTMAARLRELNGDTGRDHVAPYPGVGVTTEGLNRAAERLAATLKLWAEEVVDACSDPVLAGTAHLLCDSAAREAAAILGNLQEEPDAEERLAVEFTEAAGSALTVFRHGAEEFEKQAQNLLRTATARGS